MDKRAAPSNAKMQSCTCMRLRKASRRVTQIYDRSLEAAGLTVSQYGVLGQLIGYDGIGMGALAEKLLMDPTTLTRSLRPLQRQGLVRTRLDRRDRRSRCLHLTAKGRAAFDKAMPAWKRAQHHLAEALGESEAAALNTALDHVIERLAE